ncbi:MAG: hypothetical protein QOJ19_5031, partial [Acidimicrobiia bacterium]|nr:hypothetical protein [Acidimicrobiia bacterium]
LVRRRSADSPVDLAAFILDHGDGTGQPGLVEQIINGDLPAKLTLPPRTVAPADQATRPWPGSAVQTAEATVPRLLG